MESHIRSCSVELWELIVHGHREPQDPTRLTSTEFYNRQLNASARDKIISGINRKLLDQVDDIVSAKELWDRIIVLQEGTDLIQSALYETAKQEAHQFMIRDGESVSDAYARLGALRVRVKGLGVEKYNDGFEMNEAFIKSKVIAMIAVKQEDTNLALNLQIMTKSADLNSDDLVSYVAANENMAKAGKRLMAMNRVDEASHNHEGSHNLALKARADHGSKEDYEIEEEEEMTSTSDMATDFAFFAKKYKAKFPMLLNDKKKKRTCYNCDEDSHFANECPYEKRVDKPRFIKGVKPRLKPNPINDRYKKNKGRAFVGAEYLSDDEEEDEEKEAGVAGLAFSKPGSLFTYDYSKDYSTENDVGSSFMARTTQDDDSDDSPSYNRWLLSYGKGNQAGKQLKKKHPIKSIVTTSRPLELLHLDLFGPSHYDTLGGSKYGLVIVDDYSRYSWVFLLKSKDETHREFITFAKKAQRTYESEIKAIRTDNGTEFKNYTMQEFVDDEGIKHEFSPYTPQQNGVVERKNRTIIEMARTMLNEFNSPHNFGEKPSLRPSTTPTGSSSVPPQQNSIRASYRYYNRSTGTIEVSCDVVFLEDNGSQVEQVVPCDDDPSSAIKHMGIGHIRPMEVHNDDQDDGIEVSSTAQVEPSSTQAEPSSATQEPSSTQDESHSEEQEESPHSTEQDHDDDQETSSTHDQAQVIHHVQALARDEFIDHEGTIRKIKAATRASDMKVDQVLGSISRGVVTRRHHALLITYCQHHAFVSSFEPLKVHEALVDPDWVIAMQEELECFTRNEVWSLVERPKDHRINVIGTKWVFKNKQDENGIVIRNKARKFEMSMMGELKFFLGFQVRQLAKGTFISQEKYVKDMLKKFNMTNASPMKTPMPVKGQLGSCDGEKDVDIKVVGVVRAVAMLPREEGLPILPAVLVVASLLKLIRELRTVNPYRFEQRTYTHGDKFFWTKTQAALWDGYYDAHEFMKNGDIVLPKAINPEELALHEATKYRFVVETLKGMGLYDLVCLKPDDLQEEPTFCPLLVRQFHCTVFFHDDEDRTITWMTGKEKYSCTYSQFRAAMGCGGDRAPGYKIHSRSKLTKGDISFCYPANPTAGPPTISGMYYSYLVLAKMFRESLISKSGDTSEVRNYHLNLMYYCHPDRVRKIDGVILSTVSEGVMDRMTPNYAQYVQWLINYIVPAPLNIFGEKVIMDPFRIPIQEATRPDVPSMTPSTERRSKERHDHDASSSYSPSMVLLASSPACGKCARTPMMLHIDLYYDPGDTEALNEFMASRNHSSSWT
ncbi:hypothetical protein QYE76_027468 [Lolium multiflorum]|uniref:Uncharacterized protein n=1 Tax=Lolium multiflorum TaxID=4521 RepID=A0AAD8QJ71_LOLMU|nr:hypothetical protein QYE76_027468 [Lolium multiflorum]